MKAIAVDDNEKSVVDSIDLDSMVIEETYNGPCLTDSGTVTKSFTEELMPYLRNQKVTSFVNLVLFWLDIFVSV